MFARFHVFLISIFHAHTSFVRDRIEFEHVILAVAYLGCGFLGTESPTLMGMAYFSIGVLHTGHAVRTDKKRKADVADSARDSHEDVRADAANSVRP